MYLDSKWKVDCLEKQVSAFLPPAAEALGLFLLENHWDALWAQSTDEYAATRYSSSNKVITGGTKMKAKRMDKEVRRRWEDYVFDILTDREEDMKKGEDSFEKWYMGKKRQEQSDRDTGKDNRKRERENAEAVKDGREVQQARMDPNLLTSWSMLEGPDGMPGIGLMTTSGLVSLGGTTRAEADATPHLGV